MGSLTGEEKETVGDEDTNVEEVNDTIQKSSEVKEDIAIVKSKTTKIRKGSIHESAHTNIIQKVNAKIKLMNLPNYTA